MSQTTRFVLASCTFLVLGVAHAKVALSQAEEPDINPFGKRPVGVREDAIPGAMYYSDGKILLGGLYLTRDKKLRGFIEADKEHYWIGLEVLEKITTVVAKEWIEKEWRFLENANDTKVYTGREYPVRMYEYELTYKDGRTRRLSRIYGPLYIQPDEGAKPIRFILHDRDKGAMGSTLGEMPYLTKITFGKDAQEAAKKELVRRREEAERKKAEAAQTQKAAASQPTGPEAQSQSRAVGERD